MTAKNKFFQLMQDRNFTIIDDIQGDMQLIPHHYKTDKGDHVLISSMRFVVFGGSNVRKGGLGCVTMYYSGVKREKHCRNSFQSEILKKVGCYTTAKEVIAVYDKWHTDSRNTINSWQKVL